VHGHVSKLFLVDRRLEPMNQHGEFLFCLVLVLSFTFRAGLIAGGEQRKLSLGMNWYPTSNWRVRLNLIKVLYVKRPGTT
jgi:hypothetical protein